MENHFKINWNCVTQVTSSHHRLCSSSTFTSSTSTIPMIRWPSRPPTGPNRAMKPVRWTTWSATTTTARWWTARCSSPRESQTHTFASHTDHHEAPPDLLRHDYDNLQDVVLGTDKVIDGLDLALRGMCAGEKRLVTVPPHLGHGENGGEPTKTKHKTSAPTLTFEELQALFVAWRF